MHKIFFFYLDVHRFDSSRCESISNIAYLYRGTNQIVQGS